MSGGLLVDYIHNCYVYSNGFHPELVEPTEIKDESQAIIVSDTKKSNEDY